MADLSKTLGQEVDAAIARAEQLKAGGDAKGARGALLKAGELALRYAQAASTPAVKKQRLERAKAIRQMAENVVANVERDAGPNGRPQSQDDDPDKPDREQVRRLIARSSITWADIAGLDDLKKELITEFAKGVARAPAGMTMRPRRTILLYGPPGTGKTLFASAISSSLEATFFNIRTGDLLSSLFGKSPQLVAMLFDEASDRQPSVVFFDEFEALAPSRDRDISGAESRVVTSLLQMLDGFRTAKEPPMILTIAATNKPWQLDDAIMSRFAAQVYVPLPDLKARTQIFELNLDKRGVPHELTAAELATLTEGYSGREIVAVCEEAVSAALHASNPNLEQIAFQGLEALRAHQLNMQTVRADHFRAAVKRHTPVSSESSLARYEEWRRRQQA